MKTLLDRRSVLKFLGASAVTLPFAGLFAKSADAGPEPAPRRLIVLYFPDGVPAPPGEASPFHPTGGQTDFVLPENLAPLARHRDICSFFRGLTLGPADAGSHQGGAKKLLTGCDGGNGVSLDRHLSRTIGAGCLFPHLYLGAMATQGSASGDKFISYPAPGTTVAPEDDPRKAFDRLFASREAPSAESAEPDPIDVSVIDAALGDLDDLRARLGGVEKSKLDLHLEALREVERQIKGAGGGLACNQSLGSVGQVDRARLMDPGQFPVVLRAQIDLVVQAMACGLTRVGVVQASQHTSELVMSRFPDTSLYRPGFDMRSHQASHYGQSSDPKYRDYVLQRTWFVEQLAYLLDRLKARPEGAGSMLDSTLVLLCSEVSNGNDHSHDDMPFVLAGSAGGALRPGRLHQLWGRRHSDLLGTIAHALGDTSITTFGEGGQGLITEVLA